MQDELIVLESMVACEGFLSKIKDTITSGRKPKEEAHKTKEISLEEFKKEYEPQFKYAYKMAMQIINKETKGRTDYKNALGIKPFKVQSSAEYGLQMNVFSNNLRTLKDKNGNYLLENDEFFKVLTNITGGINENVGGGTKAPHLNIEDEIGYKDIQASVMMTSCHCPDLPKF